MADVTDRDMGLDALERDMRELERHSVKIGIQAGEGEQDGTDLLDIAIYNEFGTATIPSRPFMRQTADRQADNAGKIGERYLELVITGKLTPVNAYRRLGEWYQGVQRDAVRHGGWAPNAPSTIRRKGSNKPLIDTGKLVNAIRYEVES